MEIDNNQKKISLGDKYQIFTDGQQTHVASRQILQLLPEINLFKTGGERPRMTINKRMSFLSAKYDITRWDNNVLEFRTVSFWKSYYRCQCGPDNYEIFGHRGRKYSIFKNDQQVAWWDKNAVAWFAGDNYKILANRDCDIELIIDFCLTIDNFYNDNHDGKLLTIDIGQIGPQAKKFDDNWQPK
jgi:uncharacterized protein YxjI